MSYSISKELFEAVIGEEFNSVNDDYIYMGIKNTKDSARISINDFFFKCKEWAYNNRYKIDSHIHFVNNRIIGVSSITLKDNTTKFYQSNSEQQAVFDSCQWILDNKDKQ